MHTLMITFVLLLAYAIRLLALDSQANWNSRWQRALFLLVFPPLLLLMTAIAVVGMGHRGTMLGWQATWFGYLLAIAFVIVAMVSLVKLFYQAWRSQQKIARSPQEIIEGKTARIIATDFPYIAQIGFWQSQLVISQGLLKILDRDRLNAVLAHEQAHYNNRDTFCFFWLGWLRSFTSWLPNSEALWQELLLLREIRADRQAIQQVDSLLLAESLLLVAKNACLLSSLEISESFSAALNETTPQNRLTQRINLILEGEKFSTNSQWWNFFWLALSLLPFITMPLHY
jgi:Zn-dependent protease with chaperone function